MNAYYGLFWCGSCDKDQVAHQLINLRWNEDLDFKLRWECCSCGTHLTMYTAFHLMVNNGKRPDQEGVHGAKGSND